MSGRAERLRVFLQAGMRARFDWATCNCGLWVCDWIAQERGVDPVASLRGAFAEDAAAVMARVAAEGGISAWADKVAAAADIAVTTSPVACDVALVTTKIGPTLMLITANDSGRLIAAGKSPRGVVIAANIAPDKAWAV